MSRVLALTVVVVVLGAAPAAAHPFGPPPVADITADGHEVSVTWSAAEDDWAALAAALGALPQSQTFARNGDGQVEQVAGATVAGNLAGSAGLAAYVTEHLVVQQDGTDCRVAAVTSTDVVATGVTTRYGCPAAVTAVTVESTMLHDVHPAYRTFVRTARGATTVLTAQRPSSELRLGGAHVAATAGGEAWGAPPAGVAAGAVIGAAVVFGLRWRVRAPAAAHRRARGPVPPH